MNRVVKMYPQLKRYFSNWPLLKQIVLNISVMIGFTYLFLLLLNFIVYNFGYTLPFISLPLRELGVSMGYINYTTHPQYREWLKGFVHPLDRLELIRTVNGGSYDAYNIQNPNPQVFSWPATDKQGFINDKALPDANVLFIGDSFGMGAASGYQESIPVIFEEISGLKEYNASNSGYGLPHYREIFRHFTQGGPDMPLMFQGELVYVLLYIGNDLYPDLDTFEHRLADEQALHVERYFKLNSIRGMARLGMQGIENLTQEMSQEENATRWYPIYLTVDPYKEGLPFAFHPFNKRFLDNGWFDQARKDYIIATLKEFKQISEQTGIEVRFVILPTKLQAAAPYLQPRAANDLQEFYQSYPAIVKRQDYLLEFMMEQVKKAGFKVLNMEPILKEQMIYKRVFWPEDTHLTPVGNRIVAQSIYTTFHSPSVSGIVSQ